MTPLATLRAGGVSAFVALAIGLAAWVGVGTLDAQVAQMKAAMDALKRHIYGKKSEKKTILPQRM